MNSVCTGFLLVVRILVIGGKIARDQKEFSFEPFFVNVINITYIMK